MGWELVIAMPAQEKIQKDLSRLQEIVLKPAQDVSEPKPADRSQSALHDSMNLASIEARVHASSPTMDSIMNRPLPMPRGGINE